MSKWIKKLSIEEADAILKQRLEHKRMLNRIWAQNNKEKKKANKKAYKLRKKLEATAKLSNPTGTVIKSTYRPNWKEAPVYNCPELTYRGKT
jgi:hypothetical protein